ncbi:hypothetical protein EJP617_A070 (plasmid) [Erwinia sp. Ejp617]|nr:hypothetical protein EJP617_A070 [Erwinia sp. Ejp617]
MNLTRHQEIARQMERNKCIHDGKFIQQGDAEYPEKILTVGAIG